MIFVVFSPSTPPSKHPSTLPWSRRKVQPSLPHTHISIALLVIGSACCFRCFLSRQFSSIYRSISSLNLPTSDVRGSFNQKKKFTLRVLMFVVCLKDATHTHTKAKNSRRRRRRRRGKNLMVIDGWMDGWMNVAQANSFFVNIVVRSRTEIRKEMSPIFQLVPRQNTSTHPSLPLPVCVCLSLSLARASFKS